MSTQSIHNVNKGNNPLVRAMRTNGIFSAASGVAFLVGANAFTTLTGIESSLVFIILAGILLFYAASLFWVTSRPSMDHRLGYVAVILDTGWVVGSVAILLSGWPELTVAGKWMVGLLAEVVAFFAIWQGYALYKLNKVANQ